MVQNQEVASQILRLLGAERRRVVARWRIELMLRRLMFETNRRPPTDQKIRALLRYMRERGDLVRYPGELSQIFRVEAPFAQVLPLPEEQVIQEANPWAVFSHYSALVIHGITEEIPTRLFVSDFREKSRQRIPLGTRPEEWIDFKFPRAIQPAKIGQVPITWTNSDHRRSFGIEVVHDQSLPLYVTTIARTLCDAIKTPKKCGGIGAVLRAWSQAIPELDLTELLTTAERYESNLMRQRVGFVVEHLSKQHPVLRRWKEATQRGGSMKLVADAPYAPKYSEIWDISINVPDGLLNEVRAR